MSKSERHRRRSRRSGFTLIEMTTVVVIVGALAALAVPNIPKYLEATREVKAIGDINTMMQQLQEFFEINGSYPDDLADVVPPEALIDPWGNPYEYLVVEGAPNGKLRKDRFLVPVNSDFDLYSKGPDGKSASPFTASMSRDDIVRASDGGYIGVAENY